MGKKGSKKKTRWRTLSIGDDDEEFRNGYEKDQESDPETHSYSRNVQGGYKPRRSTIGASGTSGFTGSGSKAQKHEASGSPSQPKIIFNEDEYTRITTPRQDVLFKKGYLSRKKPWAVNASTSATPSTTESQSASHSTADGSETTEDQQLLDRDGGNGEYPPAVEPGAQLGYGTFYDHSSGYYYEYPVMLVGPAPVPAQVGPSVLAAVPCGPVPLRPIEWINPAFVPKLAGQPYCVMDYQAAQNVNCGTAVEEQESALVPAENANGTCNESGTGSTSCGGSVVGETEEQPEEAGAAKEESTEPQRVEEPLPEEEQQTEEQQVEEVHLENGMNGGPYLEPMLMQPPVHVPHVIPAVPQAYMYPGHYMFGPPLVNVNGVTIQGGPMAWTTDVAAMTAAKRRKKKKRRKQRRTATGNTEDEEAGEYSSECDNGIPSSRVPWTECPTSSTSTTTTTTTRPLNPECQEFQLRTVVEPHTSLTVVPTSSEEQAPDEKDASSTRGTATPDAMASVSEREEAMRDSSEVASQEIGLVAKNDSERVMESSLENRQSTTLMTTGLSNEADGLTNCFGVQENVLLPEEANAAESGARTDQEEAPQSTDINRSANDLLSANEKCERSMDEPNDPDLSSKIHSEDTEGNFINGKAIADACNGNVQTSKISSADITPLRPSTTCVDVSPQETPYSKSSTPKVTSTPPTVTSAEVRNVQENHAPSSLKASNGTSKKKYSAKNSKFAREPTPGPDLDEVKDVELEAKKANSCDKMELPKNGVEMTNNTCSKLHQRTLPGNPAKTEDQESDNYSSELCQNGEDKGATDEAVEASTEDSGFESQKSRRAEYPITEAVKEWLRKANSPDLFISCRVTSDSETEDDGELDEKPPKNLHGNPMSALSANSNTDNEPLLCAADYGEFARTNNIEVDHVKVTCASAVSRKKRDLKGAKKKSGERTNRRVRTGNESLQGQVGSSSDSYGHQDSPNAPRQQNLPKQDVGDVCEFSEKDSVAGMRVAVNSQIDSKRVNARRTRRLAKSSREPVENIDLKMRRVDDTNDENDEGIVEDTVSVKTFEKGEIIVSKEGKLLMNSAYEPISYNLTSNETDAAHKANESVEAKNMKNDRRNSSGEDQPDSTMIQSIGSIEEPDVLECWEAETIEPVITPKKMLQSRGIFCEGEAAEDDNFDLEHANIEHVQKYYRLARGSVTSVEEETTEIAVDIDSPVSTTVPNSNEEMIKSFCSEEIPISVSSDVANGIACDKQNQVDEAFEVYESCYTGKTQFPPIDPKLFKEKAFYGQTGEGPIPCRAACCNIQ